MKLALLFPRMRESALRKMADGVIPERSGVPVEVVNAPDGKLFLVCKTEFATFDEGREFVEAVEKELDFFVVGHFPLYMDPDGKGFISHRDYTAKLEQTWLSWSKRRPSRVTLPASSV
jgi:hypothetical protein